MRQITYDIHVSIIQTIDEDAGESAYTNHREIRTLEREVIRAIKESKRIDFGEVDAECMETVIKDIKPSILERFRPGGR